MADREVKIKLTIDGNTKEIVTTEASVKKLGSSVAGAEKNVTGLDGAFSKAAKWGLGILGVTTLVGGLTSAFQRAVAAAEEWKLIEGRINLVSDSTEILIVNQRALYALSQDTYTAYENSADLFARISNSTKELGISQKSVLDVTQLINEALIVSSATSEEQSSAITQLGQGLASGVLRGEEFNSIMENGNRIARALAEGLGVTLGELRAMAEQGELTSERVVAALLSQKNVIDSEFAQMPLRIEQSFTTLDNSITRFVGQADGAIGASAKIAGSIRDLSAALDEINLDDPENLAQIDFVMATLSRTIDMYNVLYETAENTAQIGISGIAELTYGTLGTIAEMLRRVTEMLHSVGLSSDETLQEALQLEIELYEQAEKAQKDTIENRAEIVEALEKANVTIEERIDLYRREREERAKAAEEAKKNRVDTGGASIVTNGETAEETLKRVAANDQLYRSLVKLIGSDYDKFILSVSDDLITLGEAGATWQQQLDYFEQKEKVFWSSQIEQDLDYFTAGVDDGAAAVERLNDALYLSNASGYEKELKSIADKWTGLLAGVDNPETLAAASEAINSELAAVGEDGWMDVWGENAASTLTNAMQSFLNGDFDFSTFAQGVTNSIAQGLSKLGPEGAVAGSLLQLYDPILQSLSQQVGGKSYEGAWIGTALSGLSGGVLGGAIGSMFGGGNSVNEAIAGMLNEIKKELEKQTTLLSAQAGLYEGLGLSGSAAATNFEATNATYLAAMQAYNIDRFWKPLGDLDQATRQKYFGTIEGVGELVANWPQKSEITQYATSMQIVNALYAEGVISLDSYNIYLEDIVQTNTQAAKSFVTFATSIEDTTSMLETLYESITGTSKYTDAALAAAQDDVDRLMSAAGYTEFLDFLGDLIDGLNTFGSSVSDLESQLTSTDATIQDQAIQILEKLTGQLFESSSAALDYLGSIELVGNALADAAGTLSDLDAAWLGKYSPLSKAEKALYAEQVALASAAAGGTTAIDDTYAALVAKAAVATTDEAFAPEFAKYTTLIAEQARDATRQDIVDEIKATNRNLEDIAFRLEALEGAIA